MAEEIIITDVEDFEIVAEKYKAIPDGVWWFFVLCILYIIAETFFTITLIDQNNLTLTNISIVHLGCTAFIGIFAWIHYLKKRDMRFPLLLLAIIVPTGMFGAFLYLATYIMFKIYSRKTTDFREWLDDMFPDTSKSSSQELYERIIDGLDLAEEEEENVEPFYNIMRHGKLEQKQMVLAKITRYFKPQFAPSLLHALNDHENAVRVQAATAITQIEKKFLERYLKKEKEIRMYPEDLKRKISFAVLCDDYAHSGILDPDREQSTREKALEVYLECLEITTKGQEAGIRLALGRLYIRNNQAEKAHDCLKESIDKKLISPATISWYIESLFEMKDLAKVREISKKYYNQFKDDKTQPKTVMDMLKLWSGGIDSKKLGFATNE